MVIVSNAISFIEELAERHSHLLQRANEAETDRERQHWLQVAEQLQIMINLHTTSAAT